jgi:inner membrane protein involved in colicin E2 resistance
VLGIPYQYKFKIVKEIPAPDGKVERREVEETATANAYFLPETLNVSGSVQTQKLHRGIYEAVVIVRRLFFRENLQYPILGRSRSI